MKEIYIRFNSGNVERFELNDSQLERFIAKVEKKAVFVVDNSVINGALIEYIRWRKYDSQ